MYSALCFQIQFPLPEKKSAALLSPTPFYVMTNVLRTVSTSCIGSSTFGLQRMGPGPFQSISNSKIEAGATFIENECESLTSSFTVN